MCIRDSPDKTFTCTLFGPYEGPEGLNHLTNDAAVQAFFEKHFPDVMPLLPNLLDDWNAHPVSSLVMTRCFPWNDGSRVALMGGFRARHRPLLRPRHEQRHGRLHRVGRLA